MHIKLYVLNKLKSTYNYFNVKYMVCLQFLEDEKGFAILQI